MARAFIVTDLGFGDSAKGATVDWLARNVGADYVVRHSGGFNAGHNVVLPDGRHHEFRQFGSATFMPGIRTYLSQHHVLSPDYLFIEAEKLAAVGVPDALARITIDPDCVLVTPWQVATNRLKELARGQGYHGSVGVGLGETRADQYFGNPCVFLRDALDDGLEGKLRAVRDAKRRSVARFIADVPGAWVHHEARCFTDEQAVVDFAEVCRILARLVSVEHVNLLGYNLIFEGSQGVLLDQFKGFYPHVTWTDTTDANARLLLAEAGNDHDVVSLGLLRSYLTRHGAGPFPTEDPTLTHPEPHNAFGRWQRHWRRGHLDLQLIRYALRCCQKIDALSVSHLDCPLQPGHHLPWRYSYTYEEPFLENVVPPETRDRDRMRQITEWLSQAVPLYADTPDLAAEPAITMELDRPIALTANGPTHRDRRVVPEAWAALGLEDRAEVSA